LEEESYHITDGWQRYQAAIQAGMEYLPVIIYETPVEALTATETESIDRPWTTYDWAQYYSSLADELGEPDESRHSIASKVAQITNKARSKTTVLRYLDVLSLPEEIHPLLNDGPSGTQQQWATLRNYNPDVRQYSTLRWQTAEKIARCPESVPESRQIGIAAIAVVFEDTSQAKEFIAQALSNPDTNLDTLRKQVQLGESYSQYLRIPRTNLKLDKEEKQAVIEYCRRNRLSLSTIIKDRVRNIAHKEVE
jgi:ParB/RepB/Spo0J family partition protein